MIEAYLGISSDYVIIGLAGLVCVLILIMLINAVQQHKLRKAYKTFMEGNDAKSLEETLIDRINQIDNLTETNAKNERNIEALIQKSKNNFQKFGLIKYDALEEMGGKLSFTICMMNEKNNGFILNVVHSREGCYTYMKEIIDANSIVTLAEEEQQALAMALENN